jgi:hypothetical protein
MSPTIVSTVGEASPERSLLTVTPMRIRANGTDVAVVSVILQDSSGNQLPTGGDAVTVQTTIGVITQVNDNRNGTYTAFLTSTRAGVATISATVNGEMMDVMAILIIDPVGP